MQKNTNCMNINIEDSTLHFGSHSSFSRLFRPSLAHSFSPLPQPGLPSAASMVTWKEYQPKEHQSCIQSVWFFQLENIKCTQSMYHDICHVWHQLPCVQFSNCKNGKTAQGIDYLPTCASSNHRNYDSIFTTGSEATWNLDTSKQRKYVPENEWTVRAVPTRKFETMQLSWTCSKKINPPTPILLPVMLSD